MWEVDCRDWFELFFESFTQWLEFKGETKHYTAHCDSSI